MDVNLKHAASTTIRHTLLIFEVAGQQYAIHSRHVELITAMAELQRPPGAPDLLTGLLNVAGELIPVVCLRHLFGHLDATLNCWSPLVILEGLDQRMALLVDKVNRVVEVNDHDMVFVPPGQALNDCVERIVRLDGDSVLVLSADRLLLQQEAQTVAELQQLAQQRLLALEGAGA